MNFLFWFKSKPITKEKEWYEDEWKKLKELYPIGYVFFYLGKKMCISRYQYETIRYIGDKIPKSVPFILAHYLNDNGEICEFAFHMDSRLVLFKIAEEKEKTNNEN